MRRIDTVDEYYPLDSPTFSFLVDDGFHVTLINGLAYISFGSKTINVTRRDGMLYNLNRNLFFNSRTALLAYAQRLKDCR